MTFNSRKLYALLHSPTTAPNSLYKQLSEQIQWLTPPEHLETWWNNTGSICASISRSSDSINLLSASSNPSLTISIRHPISAQPRELLQSEINPDAQTIIDACQFLLPICSTPSDLARLYWWIWRFYPEKQFPNEALLTPASLVLSDYSEQSYRNTTAALAGAMFPNTWNEDDPEKPCLLLFTFSPIQDFIKASRKFLDFWSGSYLLHYLSAQLCWHIAQSQGPDAVITPSLWGQEIIDALLVKHYPEFANEFGNRKNPAQHFEDKNFISSLSTAGFPNTISILVPHSQAQQIGQELSTHLKQCWKEIADNIRQNIKHKVSELVKNNFEQIWETLKDEFKSSETPNPNRRELEQYMQLSCWEWNTHWNAQIETTWETYFAVLPLAHPDNPLINIDKSNWDTWTTKQNEVTQPRTTLPSAAEQQAYQTLNVGTWWGSAQARLGQALQSIKNTRTWQIPVSPGERSSLSGQYSAVHPRLNYAQFPNGRGMSAGSMRLFWKVMSLTYPGLFNGSEKLNAIELTKRMAWKYGGVAKALGISVSEDDYEQLIRFPNLSAIAAARYAVEQPDQVRKYRDVLKTKLNALHLPNLKNRPWQIHQADRALNRTCNGVMFSSKWLSEDLNLTGEEVIKVRSAVESAHQVCNFTKGSPADWWVLVLGDGDSMGQYVNGRNLKPYKDYLIESQVDRTHINDQAWQALLEQKKRMGPATHVGLNQALLDFSNRLVPYITEQRCCGRVIYSGGDDVMAALPLADLPLFLRSLRAAWSGEPDPEHEFTANGGYWDPPENLSDLLPQRPLFTMGKGATMSLGVVIAHKSVPLPTVLEQIWSAEKERAKKMLGYTQRQEGQDPEVIYPAKDGICFRVIYGSGNTLEALMKGHLLENWWEIVTTVKTLDLSPVLFRLAEILPKHGDITQNLGMLEKAASVVLQRRDPEIPAVIQTQIRKWIQAWEEWAWCAQKTAAHNGIAAPGATLEDLGQLLRFTAFWISRRSQELSWGSSAQQEVA
jgi:CRISPR-associated protein Cmr2